MIVVRRDATRTADRALSPWLRVPSVPNLSEPFGMHFLYGLGGAGPDAPPMAHAQPGARRGHRGRRVRPAPRRRAALAEARRRGPLVHQEARRRVRRRRARRLDQGS